MKKGFFMFIGFLSFGLGAAGVILPILPTTPFLLLSGYCFTHSSETLHTRLKETKLYEFYVADYVETRTIPRRKKWKILVNIYILMGISIWMAPLPLVKGLLALLTIAISIYLFFKIPDREESKP